MVRPGGVVAFVTSKGTMDKESPEVRKYLAQRAALVEMCKEIKTVNALAVIGEYAGFKMEVTL
ncbi:hypothetical protein SAMN02910358_02350 [Lachnospiraceae bacterium XBB1006]|nr:hypothetical protein SAMN02910358_02350 [Lachnospiraceae bacterium XBB1006]